MRYAAVIFGTLVAGLPVGALHLGVTSADTAALGRLIVIDAKGLAALGAFVAMFQFVPKDYLRRAWALTALDGMLLVQTDAMKTVLAPALSPTAMTLAESVLVVAANVVYVAAMVLFARALKVAGLDAAGGRRARLAWGGAAVVVALLVAGPELAASVRGLATGDPSMLAAMASSLGDTVSLVLLAPLVYIVITLRGGTLRWPYLLLAASNLAWLVYDGAGMVASLLGRPEASLPLQECCRICACLFLFWAGLAQRWALSPKVKSSEAPASARVAAAA